jgi:hypothetical protein
MYIVQNSEAGKVVVVVDVIIRGTLHQFYMGNINFRYIMLMTNLHSGCSM